MTCDQCVGCTAQTWPRLVIAKEIGLLIGGVQLLPTLDAWLDSVRTSAGASFASSYSLHPANLLQLAAPYLFAGRVIGGNTHEFGMYLGAVPLMLIVWVVARRCELGRMASLAWATLGFAGLTLLLSFGRYGGLYGLLAWLPPMRSFRCPCRYLMLFQLACAVLAAIGFLLLVGQSGLARRQPRHGAVCQQRRSWLDLWRNFEPLWCVAGISAALACIGIALRHDSHIASIPAILAGPALMLAAAALVVAAAGGYRSALVGLIVLTAVDLGCYGIPSPAAAKLEDFVALACTPPGPPNGRTLETLIRFDQSDTRIGDLATMTGWRRADGYAGLEPRRRLDYGLLPALRVAGVRWVAHGPTTDDIAGLKPYNDLWMEAPIRCRESGW